MGQMQAVSRGSIVAADLVNYNSQGSNTFQFPNQCTKGTNIMSSATQGISRIENQSPIFSQYQIKAMREVSKILDEAISNENKLPTANEFTEIHANEEMTNYVIEPNSFKDNENFIDEMDEIGDVGAIPEEFMLSKSSWLKKENVQHFAVASVVVCLLTPLAMAFLHMSSWTPSVMSFKFSPKIYRSGFFHTIKPFGHL